MRIGLPFTLKSRNPLSVSSEVTSRIPKRTDCSSEIFPFSLEAYRRCLEMWSAHLVRPPQRWMLHMKFGVLLRIEDDGLVFAWRKLDGLLHTNAGDRSL